MNRIITPPKHYKNQKLMDELNEFLIMVKTHMHTDNQEVKKRYPKWTVKDIDWFHHDLEEGLKLGGELRIRSLKD